MVPPALAFERPDHYSGTIDIDLIARRTNVRRIFAGCLRDQSPKDFTDFRQWQSQCVSTETVVVGIGLG